MKTNTAHAVATPFWQRLDAIALYPLHGAALSSLVALALCSLLGLIPFIGWFFSILVWLAAYKYGFEILCASADGHAESPESMLNVGDGTAWRLLLLQIVFVVVVLLALKLAGPWAGLLTLALVAFLQPGCIMSLAINDNMLRALNPFTALNVLARVGWPYLVVSLLLFAIQASIVVAGSLIAAVLPALFAVPLQAFVWFWGLFATFHLMGYLIYQYHQELGYDPASHALPGRSDPDLELIDMAEAMAEDGNTSDAIALLRQTIQTKAVSVATHELYRRLLLATGDTTNAQLHAGQFINLLLMEKQDRRALAVLRETLAVDRDFVPLQIEHGDYLADRARQSGQTQLAVDEFEALLRRHPNHEAAPRWGLDAAMLLIDRFDRGADARQMLQQARERCADPELATKIDAALASIPVAQP